MDYELSTQAVCAKLGMELVELSGWNCCGSTPAHAVSGELSTALCVRNLDLAAKAKAEHLITPCPSCLSNHRAAKKHMEDPQYKARVDELLDEPASNDLPEMISVMQAIESILSMEDLGNKVVKKLSALKLACYYGCLMSRPAELMEFEDPENPMLMERMLTACGACVVDFPLKTVCCGASFGIPERPLTAKNAGRILDLATKLGCDALVVACPLCQMNLDLRQNQASKAMKTRYSMPVLYYTQILGLALGIERNALGLEKLIHPCDGLLKKLAAKA